MLPGGFHRRKGVVARAVLTGIISVLGLGIHRTRAEEPPSKDVSVRMETGVATNATAGPDSDVLWVDRANDRVFRALERPVEIFDGWFATAEEKEENRRLRNSTFLVRLNLDVREEGGPQFTFEPDFKLDFYLPHLNRRLHLTARSADIDDLPDRDPGEQDDDYLVGVDVRGQNRFWRGFYLGGGAKLRTLPQPYVATGWHRSFRVSNLTVTPHQRLYWAGDDGFGEVTTLRLRRPIGSYLLASATTGGKWAEDTAGFEWSQSAQLDWYWRGNRQPGLQRTPRLGLKGVVFGHKSGTGVIDKYRIETPFRYPLRKQWLIGNVAPFVDFPNARHWEAIFGVRFALDIHFDGSARPRATESAGAGDDIPDPEFDDP